MKTIRLAALLMGAGLAFCPFAGPAASAAAEIRYAVSVAVADVSGLEKSIEANSLLVELKEIPARTPGELIGRATADLTRVVAVLYANGYYGGTVVIRAAGVSVAEAAVEAAIARAAPAGPVPVEIAVAPGPPFTFGRIAYRGLAEGGPVLDPARLRLKPGDPARSDVVLAEEERIVRQLNEQGYPLARIADREVVADHRTFTLDVTFHILTDRPAVLGETTVEGAPNVDPEFLRWLAPYRPGEPYDPRTLERYRDRLRRISILSSVSVRAGNRIDASGAIPVIVEVSERKPRVIGAGGFWSTDEGASVNAYWAHRNLFGRGEELRFEGEVARIFATAFQNVDLRFVTRFTKPGVLTPADDLILSMTLIRESPAAYMRQAFNIDARIRRAVSPRLSVDGGIEFEASRVNYASPATPDANYLLIGIPLVASYDATDDRLDPTRGYRASLAAEPMADLNADGRMFAIVKATGSAYRALDSERRYILAGRLAAGSIVGAGIAAIPGDRRFYAGGGGSVRGFAFQSASPTDGAGIIGGLSLFEASAEMRIRINDTLGVVPFVDAGRAFAAAFPDFSQPLKVGAGIGLRYLTPIGPIRVDVAVPVNPSPGDPRFGVYIGLGQAF